MIHPIKDAAKFFRIYEKIIEESTKRDESFANPARLNSTSCPSLLYKTTHTADILGMDIVLTIEWNSYSRYTKKYSLILNGGHIDFRLYSSSNYYRKYYKTNRTAMVFGKKLNYRFFEYACGDDFLRDYAILCLTV